MIDRDGPALDTGHPAGVLSCLPRPVHQVFSGSRRKDVGNDKPGREGSLARTELVKIAGLCAMRVG